MKNKFLILISLTFMIMYICSCKDRCRKYVDINIENEYAKSYSEFHTGSYWIYSDASGNIIDTFTVSSFSSTYMDGDKPRTILSKCYNLESTTCILKNEDNDKEIAISAGISFESNKSKQRIRISYIPRFSSTEGSFVLYNEDIEFNPNFEIYGGASLINSYNINSKTYNNVIKFTNYDNYVYAAEGVGIIEMKTEDNVYYLLKYEAL